MTVKELIHRLEHMHKDATVFVQVTDDSGVREFAPRSEDLENYSGISVYIKVYG